MTVGVVVEIVEVMKKRYFVEGAGELENDVKLMTGKVKDWM